MDRGGRRAFNRRRKIGWGRSVWYIVQVETRGNRREPDEELVARARVHWVSYLPAGFLFVLGFGVFMQPGDFRLYLGGAIMVYALPVFLTSFLRSRCSFFSVTRREVIVQGGVFGRTSFENLLGKIEGVEVDESLLGRMLGYGTVVVVGTGGSREVFRNVSRPEDFRRAIEAGIETRAGGQVV